jgi:cell division protein FtsQ
MTIKIKQDEKLKKQKKIKKTTKKKSSGSIKRDINLAIPYRNSINIVSRKKKRKSNKKIIRKIVMLFFVICLAFSSVYAYNHLKKYLCSLDRFFIEDIEITGCKNVTESEIRQLIPFEAGEVSSLEISLGQLEKKLKDHKSELKDISMHRTNWGKKIVVSLTERVPEVFVNIGEEKKGLDFDNKPFNLKGNMKDMKIPTIVFSNDEEKSSLLNFYKQIKNYISNIIPEITEIKYGEVEDIVLVMSNKTNIYWGLPKEKKNEKKAKRLKKVLKDLSTKNKDIKSIDLSFVDSNKNKVIVDTFREEKSI